MHLLAYLYSQDKTRNYEKGRETIVIFGTVLKKTLI